MSARKINNKSRKKIVIFSPYYPPHMGGLESHSYQLNRYLARLGYEIVVFTPHIPNFSPKQEKHDGVSVFRYPAFEIIQFYPLPKFWYSTFWKMLIQLYKFQPNIVISRTRFFVSSAIAMIFAKLLNKKYIHIEHGSSFLAHSNPLITLVAKVYDFTIGALIFRSSDLNISISLSVQKFIQRFNKRPCPIIYRGIDTNFVDSIKANTNLRKEHKNKIIITYAGRLVKWKGIDNTIEAIKTLPAKIQSKILFLIVGFGSNSNALHFIAGEHTIFLGERSRKETIAILKASDVYVHSSLPGGGLSTSLLEAMYCGCLVVASPHEGGNEVVNSKNGVLLINSSKEDIHKALTEVVKNYDFYKKRTSLAKKYVKDNFTWENVAKKYEKVINSLYMKYMKS